MAECFINKGKFEFADRLKDKIWLSKLAYMVNIFGHLNRESAVCKVKKITCCPQRTKLKVLKKKKEVWSGSVWYVPELLWRKAGEPNSNNAPTSPTFKLKVKEVLHKLLSGRPWLGEKSPRFMPIKVLVLQRRGWTYRCVKWYWLKNHLQGVYLRKVVDRSSAAASQHWKGSC